MTFNKLPKNAQFAVEAVRAAGVLARTIQRDMAANKMQKEDRSPVTVADFAGQAVVAKLLHDADSDAVLVAEEGAAELRAANDNGMVDAIAKYAGTICGSSKPNDVLNWIDIGQAEPGAAFWTLDPIDGTKGYIRGDQYAVALAYIEDGTIQAGALSCPNLGADCSTNSIGAGTVLVAVRGKGAWFAPLEGAAELRPLKVSPERDIKKARMLRSFESGHTNVDEIGEFSKMLGIEAKPVALDSQAKYAVLAAGHGELLLRLLSPSKPDYREMIWDQAAGAIVTEEAGGRITDLSGKALDFTQGRRLMNNRGICATNGALHDEVLAALATLE
jgi:3'(2'), 5'-bisphosphate nucleotidase